MDRFVISKKRMRLDDGGGANSSVVLSTSSASATEEEEDRLVEEEGEVEEEARDPEASTAGEEMQGAASPDAAGVGDGNPGGGPVDLSQDPADGPRQGQLRVYPRRSFGSNSKLRRFSHSWFEQFPWLEYSVFSDAAFCFACRHFSHNVRGQKLEKSFTHQGFQNWRKGAEKLAQHNSSSSHRCAMEQWCAFKERQNTGSRILTQLDAGHSKIVKENRQYMRAVVESLRYTACQTIGQRGHKEDDQSTNRGNFLELLALLGKFDSTVSKKLCTGPGNAKYVHHDIQNELVNIMASIVREQISTEIQQADHFALMVDETKDVSKKEQISIVLRYLNKDTIHEEFLDFVPADGLDAQSLLTTVTQTLAKCNIDKNVCIAQCYDGASVMSGCNNGVQEKFRQEVPQALYIHCHAHRLNLVLVDCVHNVKSVGECFATVQMLHNFFSGSVTHKVFMEKQQELEPTKQAVELKRLSDTRWSCQYFTLWAIKKTLPAILATLEDVSNQSNAHRATEAKSLIGLIGAQFVLHICMLESIFSLTKKLSDHLQATDLDLASAIDLVFAVVDTLNDRRNAETWTKIWDCASDICEKVGISMQCPPVRRRVQPRHLQEFVVNSQTSLRESLETSDDYRNHCFFPVIDRLISELNRRFSSESCLILKGTAAVNPKHKTFMDQEVILPMATHYGVLKENLAAELHQVKRLLERKKQNSDIVDTTHDLLVILRPYKDAFVDLYKLVCISMTLPVTTATCERSFSCLRRLKTYLRNKSGDARTSNLGLLAISSRRTKELDVDAVIDRFAANHNNRRIVLL